MGELKNRKAFNTTIPIWQIKKIHVLNDTTRIPISRLVEESLNDLFKKYGIEIEEEPTNKK